MLFIVGIILGAAVVIFAFQNVQPVVVSFLGWGFEGPIAFIVLIAVALGVIISMLFSLPSVFKGAMDKARLKRHNDRLERELETNKIKLSEAEQKIVQQTTVITETPDSVIIEETSTEQR